MGGMTGRDGNDSSVPIVIKHDIALTERLHTDMEILGKIYACNCNEQLVDDATTRTLP